MSFVIVKVNGPLACLILCQGTSNKSLERCLLSVKKKC